MTPVRRRRVHLDDVDHFLGYGWSLERIAARIGVEVDSVRQALRRQERRATTTDTQEAA